jgi:CheY-like chemotaxis protein
VARGTGEAAPRGGEVVTKLKEVLLIDDSEADLLFTQIMVEAAGIAERVLPYDTAPDALAYLQRPEGHEVDLILLDINMPEMNGFEFLEAYEKLHRSQQARAVVVMLTSSPDPTDRQRSFAFGCVKHYLVKPIDRAEAVHLLQVAGACSAS